LVLEPNAQAVAKEGGSAMVAVCHKQWLREVLAPLQAAGLTVQRLVPELSPHPRPVLHVMGEPDHAQSVFCHPQGVTLLPPNTAQWHAFADLNANEVSLHAEPAMVTRVQTTLQRQPMLQTAAQRWVQASQSAWDLAQGEWAQGRTQRVQRQLQATWQTWRHAPAWRPVRWGLAVWLALQVVGLNAWAWHARSALEAQKTALHTLLTSTFPSVTLVIDAPLQMQREVDALQQKSGAVSSTDFEPLMAALAGVLPAGQSPAQIHYSAQVLRVQGVTPDTQAARLAPLQSLGLRLRPEGNDTWVLQAEAVK
jgi:general secretion pathway protein L